MKINFFSLLLLIYLLLPSTVGAAVILIDPGHGGSDFGAVSKLSKRRIKEKDIALQIAKKIQRKLKQRHSVYLTRSFDRRLSLKERADMAERVKADLIISVHINAGKRRRSNGFETYYLDNHHNKAIRKVEQVENRRLAGDELIVNQILTDLVIKRTVPKSKKLATLIHRNINRKISKRFKMVNRGIKPGIFYILALGKRPGVLLEAGFISNKRELKKIMSKRFQEKYASAVAEGIEQYLKLN